MKPTAFNRSNFFSKAFPCSITLALLAAMPASAANRNWSGSGADGNWATAGNWTSALLLDGSDSLRFQGTNFANNNNIAASTVFNSITFLNSGTNGTGTSSTANSAFNLTGNALTLSSGAPFVTTASTATITDTVTLNVAMTNNGPTITTNTNHNLKIAGVLSGSTTSFTKAGAATLELAGANTFTAKTITGGGALILSNSLALQNSALDTATGTGVVTLSGITSLTLGGLTGTTGNLASVITTGYTGSLIALTLNNGANQSYSGVIANGAADMTLTKTGAGTQTLTGTSANTYSGLTTVSAGGLTLTKTAVDAIAGNARVDGTGTLTLGASDQIANTSTVEVAAGTFSMGAFNETVAGVKLTGGAITGGTGPAPVTLTVDTSLDLQSGTSSGNVILAGAAAATKTTGSTVALSAANTYTGGTTLTTGTLQIGVASVGSVGSITSSAVGTGSLALNGGTLSSGSTTARTILNAITIGGNVALGDATATGALTFSANADLGGATRTLTTATGSGATFGGTSLVSNGAIIKDGAGFLNMANTASTYSGLTVIAGTLEIGAGNVGSVGAITSGSLGTGALTLNGGTIASGGAANRSIINAVTVGGNVTLGAATTGTLNFQAGTDLGGATRTLTTASDTTFSGIVSNGGLTKDGASTMILSANNTYTGATTITTGTLQIGAGGTTGSIASTSSVTNNSALIYNRSNDLSATYAIGGTGTLEKQGAGTLTLTNNNGYTGATNVTNGKLVVNGSISTSSLTTVSSGATLAGSGTVGATTVLGTLAVGNSPPGTMNLASLGLGAGSTYLYEMTGGVAPGAGSADLGDISGALTINTTSILDLVELGTYTAGNKFTLFAYDGALTGNFSGLLDGASFTDDLSNPWVIDYNDSTAGLNGGVGTSYVTITAIPEPSAAMLVGGLGVLVLLRRRRY